MNDSNNELYSFNKQDGQYFVTLRPNQIRYLLENKLNQQDVDKGMEIMDKAMAMARINYSLFNQCSETNCPICCTECTDYDVFRSVPNGNHNAKVMLVNKIPTKYESFAMLSHCDMVSVVLSVILSKMNVAREDVYLTDIVKCVHINQANEDTLRACIESYFLEEVKWVKPKVIVFNGTSGLKTLIKLGYINGLQDEVAYGMIYDVVISGVNVKVLATYDLGAVLKKTGEDYAKCKKALWSQMLTAFKATES